MILKKNQETSGLCFGHSGKSRNTRDKERDIIEYEI